MIKKYEIHHYNPGFLAMFVDEDDYVLQHAPSISELEKVELELAKILTHGYHLGKKIYKDQAHARRVYFAIADALAPYTDKCDESSPKVLKMYVHIETEEVEIVAN